jgi:hypothetical protein
LKYQLPISPFWTILLIGLIVLIFLIVQAYGHAPRSNAEWFSNLRSQSGMICCSGHDVEIIADADWEPLGVRYRVRIEGKWWIVEKDAIVTVPNIDGHTLVWPSRDLEHRINYIRCFMPGTMT